MIGTTNQIANPNGEESPSDSFNEQQMRAAWLHDMTRAADRLDTDKIQIMINVMTCMNEVYRETTVLDPDTFDLRSSALDVILGTFISIKKYEKKKLEYLQQSLEPNGSTTGQPWIKNSLLFRLSREVRSTIIFITDSEELVKIRDIEGYIRHTESSCLSIDRAFLHVEQMTNQLEQTLIGIRRNNPLVDPPTGADVMEGESAATQQSLSDWVGLRARINMTQWLEWL